MPSEGWVGGDGCRVFIHANVKDGEFDGLHSFVKLPLGGDGGISRFLVTTKGVRRVISGNSDNQVGGGTWFLREGVTSGGEVFATHPYDPTFLFVGHMYRSWLAAGHPSVAESLLAAGVDLKGLVRISKAPVTAAGGEPSAKRLIGTPTDSKVIETQVGASECGFVGLPVIPVTVAGGQREGKIPHFSSFPQALHSSSFPELARVLQQLEGFQGSASLVSDSQVLDGETFVRFSVAKTLQWLCGRVLVACDALLGDLDQNGSLLLGGSPLITEDSINPNASTADAACVLEEEFKDTPPQPRVNDMGKSGRIHGLQGVVEDAVEMIAGEIHPDFADALRAAFSPHTPKTGMGLGLPATTGPPEDEVEDMYSGDVSNSGVAVDKFDITAFSTTSKKGEKKTKPTKSISSFFKRKPKK